MKKNRTLLALFLALTLLLTACGAKSDAVDESWQDTPAEAPMEEMMEEEALPESGEAPAPDLDFNTAAGESTDGAMDPEQVANYSDKIIYSGYVYLETTTFDDALASLDRACKELGGFVQDSEVNGYTNYHEDGTSTVTDRWARYVVRIPAAKFDSFMAMTDGIGNVTQSSRNAENVTSQYTDYEARLSSLETQEERLLAMLEASSDLESLIELEKRLSEVRYEIESIQRNLRNLDQRLAFSTVTLELQEVEIYTPTPGIQRTFGEKLQDAFGSGWQNFVYGCQDLVLGIAWNLPTLILLALIVTAIVLIVKKVRKNRRQKRQNAPTGPNAPMGPNAPKAPNAPENRHEKTK